MVIGSFDAIINMDWLSPNHLEILWFEKALRLSLPNEESITIFGDKPRRNRRIISCKKTINYLQNNYFGFLSHIMDKKNDKKQIEEVPQVCDYPDVFPEEPPGLPLARQVEFRNSLIPRVAPVESLFLD